MSLFNYTKRKGIDIHKSDSQSQSSIGQPMQKVVKLVLIGVVENRESMGRQLEADQSPYNLCQERGPDHP